MSQFKWPVFLECDGSEYEMGPEEQELMKKRRAQIIREASKRKNRGRVSRPNKSKKSNRSKKAKKSRNKQTNRVLAEENLNLSNITFKWYVNYVLVCIIFLYIFSDESTSFMPCKTCHHQHQYAFRFMNLNETSEYQEELNR
jgi:hypothetical protein